MPAVPSAIQLASDLFSIHHHDEKTGEIIYKEDELVPILQKWGWPLPDYAGNAKEHDNMLMLVHKAFSDLHPGQLIEQYIENAKWTPSFAAEMLGISEDYLDSLLYKGGAISMKIANKLEALFGKPAAEWLDKQDAYLNALQNAFKQKS